MCCLKTVTNEQRAISATYFSIAGNFALAIIKWLAGYFGHSHALIADAIESTGDVFTSILVLMGLKYTSKPADENHPYGHGKLEPLITFIVVAFLVTAAVVIAYQSIQNILVPHKVPKAYTLLILAPIIIWKEISYRLVLKRAKETNSSALKADAWHHRSDAVTSVAAFIGISIAIVMGKGYESADDWAALFGCGFILYNSYNIFRPALGEVMDEHVYDELVERIRDVSLTVDGVMDTEKCFVRKAGMKYHVDLHATVNANLTVKEGHDIAHNLKDTLRAQIPELGHVLIHIEPHEF